MKRNSYLLIMVGLLSFLPLIFGSTLASAGERNNKDGFKHVPKNIIVMISDGCGYNQVDAASIYQYGKTGVQTYEHFPVELGMATFMDQGSYDPEMAWKNFEYVKNNATDSAAAATAMSTGYKTYRGAIGVDVNGEPLIHVMELAEERGMATGVVTSVEWSHATPASFVAHNVSRNNYSEIAQEMVYDSAVDVIMGCGHPWYDADGNWKGTPNTFRYVGGETTWDDLVAGIAGGDADGDGFEDPWTLIETHSEFQALMTGDTPERVIGIAQVFKTLQEERSGDDKADPYVVPLIDTVPTLEEMTKAALNVLDNDPDGLFLVVEGGAVDWAGHGNESGRVIEEEIDFNRSVEAVIEWVIYNSNWGETLVIVTGDHETGFLAGPGSDPDWMPLENNGAGNLPGMEWHSGSHTNQLIPFYAKGRGAKLFRQGEYMMGDPVRGNYIDNTRIAETIIGLLE